MLLSWLVFGKTDLFTEWVLTDIFFLCSGEPDHHSAGSWWPFCTKSDLSCSRTRGLQLQQPRQQHPGVSLRTWVTDIRRNSERHFVMFVLKFLVSYLGLSSLLVATADYLSTLSMSSTSLGSDSELTGMDSVLWSSAVELRRGDTKGTLLKVQPL